MVGLTITKKERVMGQKMVDMFITDRIKNKIKSIDGVQEAAIIN